MSIEISVDDFEEEIANLIGELSSLGNDDAKRAMAYALNKSLVKGRKEAITFAREAYTAPAKKLFDQIAMQRARANTLLASLNIRSKRGIILFHFKPKPKEPGAHPAGGVSVQVRRDVARHVRKSRNGGSLPFIMEYKQGDFFGILVNHGLKEKIMGPGKRKPSVVKKRIFNYEKLFGASHVQALERRDTQERIQAAIESSFETELAAQIDAAIAKMGRK